MEQITFEDYIRQKDAEYAAKCRHYSTGICYITMKETEQCPCGDYEKRKSCFEGGVPCTGQTKKYKGLAKCFENGVGCYRYCYCKSVITKDNPDKYEPSRPDLS